MRKKSRTKYQDPNKLEIKSSGLNAWDPGYARF